MHFEMKINMENSAFEERPEAELMRILDVVAARILKGVTVGSCMDSNGNSVGEFEIVVD